MLSLMQLVTKVEDPNFTREQAKQLVDERVQEMVTILNMDPEEARRRTLSNLGYCAGYYSTATADRVYDLFETEHPVFGKDHPAPDEALRRGYEMAQRTKEERRRKLLDHPNY